MLLSPLADACPNPYRRLPAWLELPDAGTVVDAVWTEQGVLVAYEKDDAVRLLRVDPEEPRFTEGPYWPFPFAMVGRLVAVEDVVYAVGAAGDRVVEIDLETGVVNVWEESLPEERSHMAPAYLDGAIYVIGGLYYPDPTDASSDQREWDCAAPADDTDGDGIADELENGTEDIDGDGLVPAQDPDSDGDTLTDGQEFGCVDAESARDPFVRASYHGTAVVRLDLHNRTIEALDVTLPDRRFGGAAIAGAGMIHHIGGRGCAAYECTDLVSYDPKSGAVTRLELALTQDDVSGNAVGTWVDGRLHFAPLAESLHSRTGREFVVDVETGNVTERDVGISRPSRAVAWAPGASLWFGGWSREGGSHDARAVDRVDSDALAPRPTLNVSKHDLTVSLQGTPNDPDDPDDGLNHLRETLVDWGDCSTSGDRNHEYARPGHYNVTYYVLDEDGQLGFAQSPVFVNTAPRLTGKPRVDGMLATLDDVRLDGIDPDDVPTWLVDWGDGNVTPARVHNYADPGRYHVRVRVTDAWGASAELDAEVEVAGVQSQTQTTASKTPFPSAAVVAVLGLAAMLRHRRPRR